VPSNLQSIFFQHPPKEDRNSLCALGEFIKLWMDSRSFHPTYPIILRTRKTKLYLPYLW